MNLFFLVVTVAMLGAPVWTVDTQGQTCTSVTVEGEMDDAECTCTCGCDDNCDRPPCQGGYDGPDVLSTFDSNSYVMNTNSKYVISTYGEDSDDAAAMQCRFRVRIDTVTNADGETEVGWVGTGFGVHHSNDAKYERNFRISLTQGVVEIRGRGYKPTPVTSSQCFETDPYPNAWTFCLDIIAPGVFKVRGEVASQSCWYEVYYEEAGMGGNTSDNDRVWIDAAPYYDTLLRGMCGDRDGAPANDDQHCAVNTGDVSNDCVEGAHQNNG